MAMTREDKTGIVMQIFTTQRVQAVVSGVAWVPGVSDRAFSAPAEFTGMILTTAAGAQASIPLAANCSRGLDGIVSVTFSTDGYIEVM
jgi:hypothetical protein